MGLGFSVENLGNAVVGKENHHIVTEGLVLATIYIGVRYLASSIGNHSSGGSEPST